MVVATYLSGKCTFLPDLVVVSVVVERKCEVLLVADSLCGTCSGEDLDDFIVVCFSMCSKNTDFILSMLTVSYLPALPTYRNCFAVFSDDFKRTVVGSL